MKAFDLQNFLSENREFVIEKYEELKKEDNFSGISLKEFMIRIMRNLSLNAKNQKTAERFFKGIVYDVYNEEVEIEVLFDKDKYIANKYKNTAFASSLAL